MNPKGIQTKIFTSVTELPKEDWNKVRQGRKIYLSFAYLEALESTGKGEIDFYYTIAYSSERNPIFIAAFQLVNFIYRGKKYSKLLLRRMCKFQTKEEFNLALLVAGNVFSNGENGFLCSEDVSCEEANSLLLSTIKKLTATAEVKKKHSIVLR